MLKTLRRIVQQVNSAPNMDAALQVVVKEVRDALEMEACTIYLLDHRHGEYVMVATLGLNINAIRKVKVKINQGLVGLVGQREEPINVDNAHIHPHFIYDPNAGEDLYKAFLGVPIIHHRNLLGVLVIQQTNERRFDETEEAFLITLSAQIAGVIAHANAIGEGIDFSLDDNTDLSLSELATFGGIPCVPGVGIGYAYTVFPKADLAAVPDRQIDNIEEEITLFENALEAAREDIRLLGERLAETLPADELALFDVYLGLLDKASLGGEVVAEIRQGQWAAGALRRVIERHEWQFASMEDNYLRERATDILDLGRRVLSHLQEYKDRENRYPQKTVLIGDEVTASDLAEVPENCLVAVVSQKGSSNSHVAILARALGIPTVMGASGHSMSQLNGQLLIVDGYYGHIYVNPSKELRAEYAVLAKEERELDADLQILRDLPAETPDGHSLDLYVNTGLTVDASLSLSVGAAGVGLFRTEAAYMGREHFPTEEEQRIIYRQLLSAFAPRPVIMRTLDIGGDKSLPYFPVEEDNPFLGWRGIRITLDHPEVFLVQIRAMLRASVDLNNLRIMFPMISSISEFDDALHLFERAYTELLEEGLPLVRPDIGVMIEVPSAVYQALELAKRADFISVGSNDLTQYMLAVDRNNARVADLYDSLHPAVLQALMQVVKRAHTANKPVSICGEMASDPISVILLLAMGFDALSMNPGSLLRVKWVIRNFKLSYAKKLLREVLEMENPTMTRFHLEKALVDAGLGGLIRAGKK